MATVADLHDQLATAGLPVVAVRQQGATASAAYSRALLPGEQSIANGILAAFVPSSPVQEARAQAKALLDGNTDGAFKLIRAVALVAMDEINRLRNNPTTSFPALTAVQLKAAIRSKLDSGDAD